MLDPYKSLGGEVYVFIISTHSHMDFIILGYLKVLIFEELSNLKDFPTYKNLAASPLDYSDFW